MESGTIRLEPYADYFQFRVQDAEAEDGLPNSWTEHATLRRIAPAPHSIAVGTARYDYALVELELRAARPDDESFDHADHVVEADLCVPSGKLAVTGGTEMPREVPPIEVTPGRYRLRLMYVPTDYRPARSSEHEPGAFLEYRIAMWPVASPTDVAVLKQGDRTWAG